MGGMSWIVRASALAAVLVALVGLPAAGQETTGTITGNVLDASGGALPGATVTLTHVATGRAWEVVSTETGRYTAALLPPGEYRITATLAGFRTAALTGIRVSVNDRLEIDLTLAVGGVTETVEVTAESPLVQPISAVQGLVGSEQVQELPINNRSFLQLATLVPGVSSDLGDEVNFGLTNVVSVSINGARRNAVNWLVDGASNVDVGSNITLLSTPTLESIQEFRIITSSYAAEWPRSGGGVVNVVTRGGSRRFSGSLYEFVRNDALNANSFFRHLSPNPAINSKPPYLRYHNFGYTVGGPALPSREKLYFFWSEEWRRIRRAPGTLTATVPTPAWLTDPSSPNYVAPEDRDPIAVRLMEAWPAPNVGTNRFVNVNPNINNTRQETVRVDFDLNRRWRVTGRYTHDLSQTRELGGLFFGIVVPNVATTDTSVPGNVASMSLRTIAGQRALNELKYQFSGNTISTKKPEGTRNTKDEFGISNRELFAQNNGSRIPIIRVLGLATFGATQPIRIEYRNHTFTDDFTWMRGNHAFKTGVVLTFEQKNENAANTTQGDFTFNAGGGFSAFQNFLRGNRDGACGTPCTYSEAEIDITNHLRFNRYEMYAQDTWKIRRNLTLDYGVRYSLYPPVVDRDNVLDTFAPSAYDPRRAPAFANAAGTLVVLGTGDRLNGIHVAGQNSPHGRAIYPFDKNNVMPRGGVSWDPFGNGRTIVRSGYGVYYDQPLIGIFEQNAFVNPPFANTVVLLNPSLADPGSGVPLGTAGVRSLIGTSDPFITPRTQQWNIGVQRQLYRRGVIDVSYVGSRGDNLIQPVDINLPQPADVIALGSLNRARPYLGYSAVTMRQTTARNRYHGLLTQFRHQAGRAGSLTVNYTLSRNRTTSTNDRDAIDLPQNPLDLEAEYGDARTDRRHIFTASYIYELPFFRESTSAALKAGLGGWQVAGITNIWSGPPIPRLVAANTAGGQRGNRLNQVSDPRAGQMTFPFWFDPAAFVAPPLGTYGTTPRAPFRLPGRHQWDITLSKNFYPTGTMRVQVRADLINAFNHTQWLGVNAACPATAANPLCAGVVPGDTFGQITSTRLPREVQFGLKLYW